MTSFASIDSNHLGTFLAPSIARQLINSERKAAYQCEPKEREERFERANRMADMLGYYQLMRAAGYGR